MSPGGQNQPWLRSPKLDKQALGKVTESGCLSHLYECRFLAKFTYKGADTPLPQSGKFSSLASNIKQNLQLHLTRSTEFGNNTFHIFLSFTLLSMVRKGQDLKTAPHVH